MPKKRIDPRTIFRVGRSVELHTVETLAEVLGLSIRKVLYMLRDMGVPLFHIGDYRFFSIYSLEKAIFMCTEVGAPGYAGPGSRLRKHQLPRERHELRKGKISARYHTEVRSLKEWFGDKPVEVNEAVERRMEKAAKARLAAIGSNVNKLLKMGGPSNSYVRVADYSRDHDRDRSRRGTPEHSA